VFEDHVAVAMFLQQQVAELMIYSPCNFVDSKFADVGGGDWKTNPGRSANYYHSLFSKKVGRNTLEEIALACQLGAVLDGTNFGFHARNDVVASLATHMIAFTWSNSGSPDDGGSRYTWQRCPLDPSLKVHICLKHVFHSC